jgi:hypothetical protein
MKLFSQRKGLKETRTEIQTNDMDEELRNRLWNLLKFYYWDKMDDNYISRSKNLNILFTRIWHFYLKKPVDEMSNYWEILYKEIRAYFFGWNWYEVYDFLEFVASNYEDDNGTINNDKFRKACNLVLEAELSAYRFVGNQITEITSKNEIEEIDEAIDSPFTPVNIHLENSLKLMSNRKTPDYRNSVKESISAVEAICRIITNDEKATLGKALDKLEKQGKIELHCALKKAFDCLYGYTSSEEGIRHSLLEEPNLSFEDSKFMLVSCSAFVNYLVAKTSKAGIKI